MHNNDINMYLDAINVAVYYIITQMKISQESVWLLIFMINRTLKEKIDKSFELVISFMEVTVLWIGIQMIS